MPMDPHLRSHALAGQLPPKFSNFNIFGIDLGETHFRIAQLDPKGTPVLIRNQLDCSDSLAAAVFFDTADNIIVGSAAEDMLETNGDRFVRFNRNALDSQDACSYTFFGKTYTQIDICSLILRRLKNIAQEQGKRVDNVVITCPPYFGLTGCNAIRAAARAAGMEVLDLIHAPLAAVLSCPQIQLPKNAPILLCDLGGRSFDVSLFGKDDSLHSSGQKFRYLAFESYELGGADWSDVLHYHLLDTFCDENGLFPDELDADTRQALRSKSEYLKIKLTDRESVRARIFVNGSITSFTITRAEFETMAEPLTLRAMCYVEALLDRIRGPEPGLVLLTGGGAMMPMLQQAMENRFPGNLLILEPGQAAVMGAAIYARKFSPV